MGMFDTNIYTTEGQQGVWLNQTQTLLHEIHSPTWKVQKLPYHSTNKAEKEEKLSLCSKSKLLSK